MNDGVFLFYYIEGFGYMNKAGYEECRKAIKRALRESYEEHLKNYVENKLINTKPQSNFKLKK